MPQRAYLVTESARKATTILLRAPELGSAGRKAMCALCEDHKDNDDVYRFVAPKAGAAGKNRNSVGTLLHSAFTCSRNVCAEVLPTPIHPDPELVKAERIRKLLERTEQFIRKVRG